MRVRPLLSSPPLWIAASLLALAIGVGCSSATSTPEPAACDGGACADASSPHDSGIDAPAQPDAGPGGDAAHDGPPPDALYGSCAITGSFGAPCTHTTTGPDPAECTDPKYPDCFVGGQGAWCTKTCTANTDCTSGTSDAGCIPTGCNAKGYCK